MKGRFGVIFLIIIMAILLSGCGKKEDDYSMGIDGYVYVAKQVTTPDNIYKFKVRNGYLYWLEFMGDGMDIHRSPVESGFGDGSVLELPEGESMFPEGMLLASSAVYEVDEEENLYYVSGDSLLVKQHPDGTEGYRISVGDRRERISSLMAGTQGQLFAATSQFIYVIDVDGKIVDKISVGEYTAGIGLPDGSSFIGELLKGDDGSLLYSVSGAFWEIVEDAGGFRLNMWESYNDGFLASTRGLMYNGSDGILYCYNRKDSTYDALLRWTDSDLSKNGLDEEILWLSDEEIMVHYGGSSPFPGMFLLKKTSVEDLPQKETLIFAVFTPSQQLEQYVMKFNRNNEKYRISMEYYQGEEGTARLDAQIVSSNPPDLIELYRDDMEKYARKDALEDLSFWLDQSTVLKQEDFPENILNACTVGGKLVCIPNEFQCSSVVVGRSSQVGNRTGWTADDVKDLMERYPELELFKNMSFPNMVREFFGNYIIEKYIDWKSGECRFDGEDFIAFMEWMAGQARETESDFVYETYIGTMPEERLLSITDIYRLEELLKEEVFFQEKVTAIGYPSADGSACYCGDTLNQIGILANSDQKEGAWQFIEAFLTDEEMSYSFLPVRKSVLLKKAEELMTPDYWLDDNGEKILNEEGKPHVYPRITFIGIGDGKVEVDYMTQEQMDQVLEVIYSMDFTWRSSLRADILDIIVEEMAPCLKGQKTFEEAANVVQNRVRNLVGEYL